MMDKWWLNLRSGDKVYTVGDRRKNSGVATVLQNCKSTSTLRMKLGCSGWINRPAGLRITRKH